MKTDELMIGNYIEGQYDDDSWDLCEVVVLDAADITEYSIWVESKKSSSDHDFRPIPLTEDWLIKFGFTSESALGWFDLKDIGINYKENRMTQEVGNFYNQFKIPEFVHQLQNLYFALTGEKLKLKE